MATGTQSDPHVLPASGQEVYSLAAGEHWFKSQQSGYFGRYDVGAQTPTTPVSSFQWVAYGDGSPLDADGGYSANRTVVNPGNYAEYTLKVTVDAPSDVQVTLLMLGEGP